MTRVRVRRRRVWVFCSNGPIALGSGCPGLSEPEQFPQIFPHDHFPPVYKGLAINTWNDDVPNDWFIVMVNHPKSLPSFSVNNSITKATSSPLPSVAFSIQKKHLPDLDWDKVLVSFCIDSWVIPSCEHGASWGKEECKQNRRVQLIFRHCFLRWTIHLLYSLCLNIRVLDICIRTGIPQSPEKKSAGVEAIESRGLWNKKIIPHSLARERIECSSGAVWPVHHVHSFIFSKWFTLARVMVV